MKNYIFSHFDPSSSRRYI